MLRRHSLRRFCQAAQNASMPDISLNSDIYSHKEGMQGLTHEVKGVEEYKLASEAYSKRNYAEAQELFKKSLGVIKQNNQEQSLAYSHVITRLAHCCYVDTRFKEAEQYFRVAVKMAPLVAENDLTIYRAHKNLIAYLLRTNIEGAKKEALLVARDSKMPALAKKESKFVLGTVSALNKEYAKAKENY